MPPTTLNSEEPLFGGTFIEGRRTSDANNWRREFPFLFGGTFIEGFKGVRKLDIRGKISLPFRRDFH